MAEHQDWKTVVLNPSKRKGPSSGGGGGSAADSTGPTLRYDATSNKQRAGPANARKLEEEDEDFHHAHVGRDIGIAIQRARQGKKWSQADLAKRINEKSHIVNEYEGGKAIINQQVLSKMERVLGVRLPRPGKKKK